MPETKLTGLEGNNPLGFLAALGVQELFRHSNDPPCLWWTDDSLSCAVVDAEIDTIIEQASNVLPKWSTHRSLNPAIAKADSSAKFLPADIRRYLAETRDSQPGSALATALVAEGSLDNNGVAKPSDLYFTAGKLLFVKIARAILMAADDASIKATLLGPWKSQKVSSLGWDPSAYIPYSLTAIKPGTGPKSAHAGVEALALLGMARHPVFRGTSRTLTQGCSGTWQNSLYTWPLWNHPSGYGAVRSLLDHARSGSPQDNRSKWYRAWSVFRLLQSHVPRTKGQGGGFFGPPRIIWPTS